MGRLADVVTRMAKDPVFAAAVRADPRTALEPYALTGEDLTELARILGHGKRLSATVAALFETDEAEGEE